MQLTIDEEDALMTLIEDLGPAGFEDLLFKSTRVRLSAFVGPGANLLTVSMEFVTWLRANSHHTPNLLTRAILKHEKHASISALRAAQARLLTVKASQDQQGPPVHQVLAGGVPVVNRDVLRSYLSMLIAGSDPMVVVVEGESGLGRSHSWNLIHHVATRLATVRPIYVDLIGPVLSQQSLPRLFDYLVRVLGLPPGDLPTQEGVTSITLSERFLSEFVTRVQSMPEAWARTPWLVFDHLDRDIAPETKLFVMGLASLRLQRVVENCVMFLLGPDPTIPLTDPAALARRELLSALLDYEIAGAVARLNSIGLNRLDDRQLEARLDALTAACDGLSGRARAVAACNALVALRQAVGVG